MFVLRAFEDDDVTGPVRPARAPRASSSSSSPSPTSRRSRSGSSSAATAGQARPSRSATRSPRSTRPTPSSAEGRPLYRAGLERRRSASCSRRYFLLTNRRVLAVVNVGEDELDAIPEAEARVAAEFNDAGDNVEVIGMCVQLEAEAAAIVDPDERAEMLEGFGLGEGALFRMVRTRLPPARAAHVPHHRREGVAGLDVHDGLDGARSAPGGSTPTSSAASSGPR